MRKVAYRTHLKNTAGRDIGRASRGREARMKAYPWVRRVRGDNGIAKRGHIPKGFGSFPAPPRYASSPYRKGTASSASLAGSGKERETRLRGIFEMGSK